MSCSISAFAGEWKQDAAEWWYQNDDGNYPKSAWQVIDEKQYYFNDLGYMLTNARTPDGFFVGADGVWDGQPAVPAAVVVSETAAATTTEATTEAPAKAARNSGVSASPFDGYTIIVNTSTKKYHVPSCSSVADIKSHNMGYCDDSAYLDSQGYAACKRCH